MVLVDAILLLSLLGIAALFWQGRKQSEQARRFALQYCKQHQLQFLDYAWLKGHPGKRGRHVGWVSYYQFAFSSDRETRYEGTLELINLRLVSVSAPAYRVPESVGPESEPRR